MCAVSDGHHWASSFSRWLQAKHRRVWIQDLQITTSGSREHRLRARDLLKCQPVWTIPKALSAPSSTTVLPVEWVVDRTDTTKLNWFGQEKRKTTSGDTEGVTRKYTRQSVDRTETLLENVFLLWQVLQKTSLCAKPLPSTSNERKCALYETSHLC